MNIFLPQLALLGLSPTMKDGSDFGGCGGKSWLASIMFKAKNQALERNRGSNGGKKQVTKWGSAHAREGERNSRGEK